MADTLLRTTDLRTPVGWLLDSDADVEAVLASMTDAERAAPEARYYVGVGALSRRDWTAAATAFAAAEADPKWGGRAARLRVYALARGGDAAAARAAMAAARAKGADTDEAKKFWAWYDAEPSLPH